MCMGHTHVRIATAFPRLGICQHRPPWTPISPGEPGPTSHSSTPGPAPGAGDNPFGVYYEIPIAIQDRSFNADGSLFYPDHRAFFEGLDPSDFADFPFFPSAATCDGFSDVAKIWQPEFLGNMMVVK